MKTNIIYNIDVLDGFKKMPSNSIDLLLTSPPYNCGIEYDTWNDNLPWEEYLIWCKKWICEIKRVLKPDGRFAINCLIEMGIPYKDKKNGIRVSPQLEFYKILIDCNLHITAQPVWIDSTKSTLTAWGSWKNASAPYIYNPCEIIIIGYKDQWKKIKKGINTISKKDFIKGVSGVWNILPETHGQTKANFPIALPKLCIELLTYKNDIVLDPFMGSGTTAVACIKTNRQYIGFEISKNYTTIANKRIKESDIFNQIFN